MLSEAEKRKNVLTYGAAGLAVVTAGYFSVSAILRKQEAEKLLDNAGNDVNAQYAIQIRSLTDKGITEYFFGISGEARAKLNNISGRVRDFTKVQRAYRTLYNRDILGDLRSALTQQEYVTFMQNIYNGNPQNPVTPPPAKVSGEVVATRATAVYPYPFAGFSKPAFAVENLEYIGVTNGQRISVLNGAGQTIVLLVVQYKEFFGWVQNTGLVVAGSVRIQ